jgi:hypothetical protein
MLAQNQDLIEPSILCIRDLKTPTLNPRAERSFRFPCSCTRFLQAENRFGFSVFLIKSIVWDSLNPNCAKMESKGVRSSQAIRTTRSRSSSDSVSAGLLVFDFKFLSPRQRLLQYFTSSHTFSHFLRQVKLRLQTTQTFSGKGFFIKLNPSNL